MYIRTYLLEAMDRGIMLLQSSRDKQHALGLRK